MSITSILRNFNGNPNIVTIVTDNNLAAITTAGYWDLPETVDSVAALQNGEWQWESNDLVLINYSPSLLGFFVFDAVNRAFDALSPSAGLADTLQAGDIFVGNAFNIATGVPMTGDIGIDDAGVTDIQPGVVINADIDAAAAIDFSKLAALSSANVLVGSAGNVATSVAMTGDISISNAGVTAIVAGVIVDADVNAAAAISFSKLAALPDANILVGSAGNVATAVAVSGVIAIDNAGVTSIAAGSIVNADVNAAAAIDFSKLAALPSAQILVGSAGNVAAAVAMSGDVTISNAGVTAIAAGAIVNADVNAAAAIDYSKLAALTSGNVLVGSAGNVATSVAMSGDATIVASGALTIANDAITTVKILDANVTLAKLATGISPSHVIKFADQVTSVGGAAAEAFAVLGALAASDRAFVQMVDNGTNNVSVLQAVVTNDTLTVTFSADPGNDAVINYQLIRVVS